MRRPRTLIPLTIFLLGVPGIGAAQTLSALTLSPNVVVGGLRATGQVVLSGRAPTGGFVVQLSSSNPAVAYAPLASVTVPAGATTQSFTVTTVPVGLSTTVTIAAFAEGGPRTALLNVQAVLSSVTLAVSSRRGGLGVSGVVRLFLPAPPGGLAIQLASSDPAAATVPASTLVPAGETTAGFTAVAIPVAQNTRVIITATVDGLAKTAQLTVEPPVLLSLVLGPASVRGGVGATGEVKLAGPAPSGGFPVTLSSGNPAMAAVPAGVTVPAGAETVRFTITTDRVAKAGVVKITASAAGETRGQQLTVTP